MTTLELGTCEWCGREDRELILSFDLRNNICKDYITCTEHTPAGSRMMFGADSLKVEFRKCPTPKCTKKIISTEAFCIKCLTAQQLAKENEIKHGTVRCYRNGCTCEFCKNAYSKYQKIMRATYGPKVSEHMKLSHLPEVRDLTQTIQAIVHVLTYGESDKTVTLKFNKKTEDLEWAVVRVDEVIRELEEMEARISNDPSSTDNG